jgi:predicted amidohydrolase
MREFVAAAVQVAPAPGPLTAAGVAANTARAIELTRQCSAATGAELIVLPESVTTGFTPGVGTVQLWDLVSELPGPVLQPFAELAAELGIHLVLGTYERGPERGVVYNAAVVLSPAGELLGVYRKTHPFGTERADRGGWWWTLRWAGSG